MSAAVSAQAILQDFRIGRCLGLLNRMLTLTCLLLMVHYIVVVPSKPHLLRIPAFNKLLPGSNATTQNIMPCRIIAGVANAPGNITCRQHKENLWPMINVLNMQTSICVTLALAIHFRLAPYRFHPIVEPPTSPTWKANTQPHSGH